ncbi:hypothetical protein FRC11_002344 [Ceratobasidium sp. 423]|nr:hypothetical protein FRC11_002344 [Ceratobasidium sp. 423]
MIANHTQAPAIPVDPEFAYSDGNVELQVSPFSFNATVKLSIVKTSTLRFWIHEFQLAKFVKIAELIRQARVQGEISPERRVKIRIHGAERLRGADFRNAFRLIYSKYVQAHHRPRLSPHTRNLATTSVVSDPSSSSFDKTTLVSALRVAILYQNPGLQSFAITRLQSGLVLPPIYRIALSDELLLPDWETSAFSELCRRPEPISQKEAKILGITRFVEIARIREVEQRRQYIGLIGRAAANPFLNTDGTVKQEKLQAAAKNSGTIPDYGSCPVRDSSDYPPRRVVPKPPAVGTREVHRLALRLASESYTLYKHLSDALGRLGALTQSISATTRGLGSDKEYSDENELKQASWIRKAK